MITKAQELGCFAEDKAAEYLLSLGWRVLARNVKNKYGELDMKKMNKAQKAKTAADVLTQTGKVVSEIGESKLEYETLKKLQERKNLATLTPSERLNLKKGKSAPDKNSEEYLTYILKQAKKPEIKNRFEDLF